MEPPSTYRIHILNDSGRELQLEALGKTLRDALQILSLPSGDLSVRICTDEEIRSLNRRFREIDQVTDVLTFPADPTFPTCDVPPLGDIAIAAGQASRQADGRRITLEEEVAYLAIHGLLHLTGLDDETEAEREVMVGEMSRIGTQIGLPRIDDWHTMPAGLK